MDYKSTLKILIRTIFLVNFFLFFLSVILAEEGFARWYAIFFLLIGLVVSNYLLEILFKAFPTKRFLTIVFILIATLFSSVTYNAWRPESRLIDAAEKGNVQIIRNYLNSGGDPNVKKNDISALHRAAGHGYEEIVALLVSHRADVNIRSNRNATPLHWAMFSKNMEIASLLINNGADVNAKNENGNTPLHLSATFGSIDQTLILLANGANINAKGNNGYTPLHAAAWKGHTNLVKLLIENGAEVNARMASGNTPLTMALKENHQQTANLLNNYGATE
ncbi:MAG: ankyrin repeat domain-containing protein [Spirulinaceae cyanobacterium]